MQQFTKDGMTFRMVCDLGSMGQQYECTYSDGFTALAVITKRSPTRADIVEAFE